MTRPSEETREHTLGRLRRGYASGRLDTETFSRRVDCALHAGDSDELRGLTVDLPAPRTDRLARLRGLFAPRRPRLALPDDLTAGHLVLGRAPGCQLVFADDTVSRRHAELRISDGRWMLRDLGSSNGTWVNGRRIVEAEVGPGDEVALGHCRIRL